MLEIWLKRHKKLVGGGGGGGTRNWQIVGGGTSKRTDNSARALKRYCISRRIEIRFASLYPGKGAVTRKISYRSPPTGSRISWFREAMGFRKRSAQMAEQCPQNTRFDDK